MSVRHVRSHSRIRRPRALAPILVAAVLIGACGDERMAICFLKATSSFSRWTESVAWPRTRWAAGHLSSPC